MGHWPAYIGGILTGYLCTVAIALLADRDRCAKSDRGNWRRIAPGSKHWISLAGSLFFTIGLFSIRTIVGSARPDSEQQLQTMNWLVMFFGICTAVCIWNILRIWKANVFWRGSMICFSDAAGTERLRSMSDVLAMESDQSGNLAIWFDGFEVLKIDRDAKGAEELYRSISNLSQCYLKA